MKKIITMMLLLVASIASAQSVQFDYDGVSFIADKYTIEPLIVSEGWVNIQRDWNGRITWINSIQITYDYNGRINWLGGARVDYDFNGRIRSIGGMYFYYDWQGNLQRVSGTVW